MYRYSVQFWCSVNKNDCCTKKAPTDLNILAQFVVKVYAPVWFSIKLRPHVCDGPRHFFSFLKYTAYMPKELRDIVRQVAQNNAFFAHREQVVLSMLSDENENTRKMAVDLIFRARRSLSNNKTKRIVVRKLKLPQLIPDARYYYEMIQINDEESLEPPFTKRLDEEELRECIKDADVIRKWIGKIPCHSQAVERAVKLTSSTSTVVMGENKRNAIIHTKIAAQKALPRSESKQDYTLFLEKPSFM